MTGVVSVALDPTLDAESMRPAFERFGRIHIPAFLTSEAAEAVYGELAERTPWRRTVTGGGKIWDIPVAEFEAFPPERKAEFDRAAQAEARRGFHYVF